MFDIFWTTDNLWLLQHSTCYKTLKFSNSDYFFFYSFHVVGTEKGFSKNESDYKTWFLNKSTKCKWIMQNSNVFDNHEDFVELPQTAFDATLLPTSSGFGSA